MATLTKKDFDFINKYVDDLVEEVNRKVSTTLEEISKQDKEVFSIC
jgi:hypothetical protein